jgi:hypothetical protein
VPVSGPLRERPGYRAQAAGQPGWDWFFPGSKAGQPLTLGNVYKNFRRFLWQARISNGTPSVDLKIHSEKWQILRGSAGRVAPAELVLRDPG